MTTTRRGFFGSVAAAFGAMTLDTERALWIPGQKLISIPKAQPFGKMTAEKIIQAALQEIGVLLPGEIPSKNDTDVAMFRLNAMIHSWNMRSEYVAYAPRYDELGKRPPSSVVIADEQVESAIYGLAVRLAPLYDGPIVKSFGPL